jgi:succinate dehydrogenase/fumarate reductase flavoprotein subunit
MPCAIRAAERGLSVLVIEKDTKPGGTLHLTAGHLSAAGTRLQQLKGITDSPDEHYEDIVRISRNTMDPAIAHKAVTLAPGLLDWLDELGYPFHPLSPVIIHGHEPYNVPRTWFGQNDYAAKDITGSGKTVWHTLYPLWEKWVTAGKISPLFQHRLTGLQREGNTITAVELMALDTQNPVVFSTKKGKMAAAYIPVVVTTGGYASNPDFYQSVMQPYANDPGVHFPKRLLSTASMQSQGEGAAAIMEAGGLFSHAEKHISTLGGIELEPGSGRADFWAAWARVSNSHDRAPREIYINTLGQRFMNEYDLTVDQRERLVLQQPGQCFYAVFDEAALQAGPCIVVQWDAERFKAEAQQGKCCWQANTLSELAGKISVPEQTLHDTVSQYNTAVSTGKDDAFGRSLLSYPVSHPPFYALLVYAYSLISFGGIVVNENLQVTGRDGQSFTNLYAAGEILGAGATSGNAFCGGMLLTPALSFGKWLGDTL